MGFDDDRRLTLRGRWTAILFATVVYQIGFWPAVAAVAMPEGGSGGAIALALALVPFAFGVLAFASRHPSAPGAVLKAMGLFLLIGLPVTLLDVAAGLVAGHAAGAVVALRPADPPVTGWRWAAAGLAVVYVFVLLFLLPPLALLSAAVLPYAVHGLVDQAAEGRAEAQRRADAP
jgi:hypothetical protein